MAVFICDFELLDRGRCVVALPVGLDGATEGLDFTDAIRMAADWLRETAIDYLISGDKWPDPPLGTEPTRGGRMVTLATEVSLDQIPAVPASEAARMLGVSTARVSQLVNAGYLESWKVGGTRMVSLDSIETRLDENRKAGRPKKELATV